MPDVVVGRCLRDRMQLVKQAIEDTPADVARKELMETLSAIVNRCKMTGIPDASLAEVLYALKSTQPQLCRAPRGGD